MSRPMRVRRQRGAALVTVMVVLVALAVIVTPFALSMRNLESSALHGLRRERARAGAELARDAALDHLQNTHPLFDTGSPHYDPLEEITPPDLLERYDDLLPRDPTAALRSVSLTDEQGKVNLSTASIYLLGNLLGGRTSLTIEVDAEIEALGVVDAERFRPAGLAVLGIELIEYSARAKTSLDEVRRGFPSPNVTGSLATRHPAGSDVFDLRVILAAQHAWRIRPGLFDVFRRVEGLKDIGLFGEMTYTADEIDAIRPLVTVHGGAIRWQRSQPVLDAGTDRVGASVLSVPDGSHYGAGTIVRLSGPDGGHEWHRVIDAVDWGDHWRLTLFEPTAERHADGASSVAGLARDPVNINTARPEVLEALLSGLGRTTAVDVITATEAVHVAGALQSTPSQPDAESLSAIFKAPLEGGTFSLADLTTAALHLKREDLQPDAFTLDGLAAELTGLVTRQSPQRLTATKARALAERIKAFSPASDEELRTVLDEAVAAGVCTEGDREAVLRCAIDPGDAALNGGTAPFVYASGGVFEITAGASLNLPNGREQARAFLREIVSAAPAGESARAFSTQRDFDLAARRGVAPDGWISWPQLLVAGPGAKPPPALSELAPRMMLTDVNDPEAVVDLVTEIDALLGTSKRVPVDRAGPLVSGAPGPSDDERLSYVSPTPVTGTLPGTLHFDEGLASLVGSTPGGIDTHGQPVTLSLAGLQPWRTIGGTGQAPARRGRLPRQAWPGRFQDRGLGRPAVALAGSARLRSGGARPAQPGHPAHRTLGQLGDLVDRI